MKFTKEQIETADKAFSKIGKAPVLKSRGFAGAT